MTEEERLRRALRTVRQYMRVVVSSPVCHPHNAIVLRDAINDASEALGEPHDYRYRGVGVSLQGRRVENG